MRDTMAKERNTKRIAKMREQHDAHRANHPIVRLRAALEECLTSNFETHKEYMLRLRAPVDEFHSQIVRGQIALLEPTLTEEFQNAARFMIERLVGGISGTETHEVIFAASAIRNDLQSRRWLKKCEQLLGGRGQMSDEMLQRIATQVPELLSEVDSRALGLSTDDVLEALRNRRLNSGPGLAARLAARCGALDYSQATEQQARLTFAKAARKGRSPQ